MNLPQPVIQQNYKPIPDPSVPLAPQPEKEITFDWENIVGGATPMSPSSPALPAQYEQMQQNIDTRPDVVVDNSIQRPLPAVGLSQNASGAVVASPTPAQEDTVASRPVVAEKAPEASNGNHVLHNLQRHARSVRSGVASTVAAIAPALGMVGGSKDQGEGRGQTLSDMLAPKRSSYTPPNTFMSRRPRRRGGNLSSSAEDVQIKQVLIKRLRDLHKTGVQLSIEESSFNVVSRATLEFELKTAINTLRSDSRAETYTKYIIWMARFVTNANTILGLRLPGMHTYVRTVRNFMDKPLSRYQMYQLVAMYETSVSDPKWYFLMGMGAPIVVAVAMRLCTFAAGYFVSPYNVKLAETLFNSAVALFGTNQADDTPSKRPSVPREAPTRTTIYEEEEDEDDDDLAPPSAQRVPQPSPQVGARGGVAVELSTEGVREWRMP